MLSNPFGMGNAALASSASEWLQRAWNIASSGPFLALYIGVFALVLMFVIIAVMMKSERTSHLVINSASVSGLIATQAGGGTAESGEKGEQGEGEEELPSGGRFCKLNNLDDIRLQPGRGVQLALALNVVKFGVSDGHLHDGAFFVFVAKPPHHLVAQHGDASAHFFVGIDVAAEGGAVADGLDLALFIVGMHRLVVKAVGVFP